MVAPAFETLPNSPEDGADPAPDSDSQILVLDPTGGPGSKSILLDQPKQLIGWDVECSIQLPDSGIHARHAVILRGQRQVVVKAWDPRTWLNGNAVTESPLSPGDLLKVGPVEFRVRTATADELLRDVPGEGRPVDRHEHSVSGEWLELRRTRLAAIRRRLKQRRTELENEFQRLDAERARFESLQLKFQSECEKSVIEAHQPDNSSERVETGDTVTSYMQGLLLRMRAERPGDYAAESGAHDSAGSQTVNPEGDSELTDQSRKTRRVHNVNEVRAGVGTLREIANFSARVAVATHSSRKLRRSVAITLPLACVSFVLAAVLMLLGGSGEKVFGQAFGTMMLGVIVAIEMAHSLWKIRRLQRVRMRSVDERQPEAVPADSAGEPNGTGAAPDQCLSSSPDGDLAGGSCDSSPAG